MAPNNVPMEPDEYRLKGRLKEAAEHLDKLEELLHKCGCDEMDKELDGIRETITGIWTNR